MRVVVLTLLVAIAGCKQSKQVASESKEVSIIEDGWKKTPNANRDYFLYLEVLDEGAENSAAKRSFYIADADGNKIYEESIYGGYVKWIDSSKVEYFSTPGALPPSRSKEDFIMIYDLETEEVTTKETSNN